MNYDKFSTYGNKVFEHLKRNACDPASDKVVSLTVLEVFEGMEEEINRLKRDNANLERKVSRLSAR